MKLAVILEDTILSGGGFNQGINAIKQVALLSNKKFNILIFTNHEKNLTLIDDFCVNSVLFKTKLLDKVFGSLARYRVTRRLLRFLKLLSPFEKMLLRNKCDLVYFVAPTERVACLQRLNYILTAWDNCHRDFPEFPEVRIHGEFADREYIFQFLPQAFLTIVDSDDLADRLNRRYGVDRDRLLIMPFSPNPQLQLNKCDNILPTLVRYGLNPGYFLYPAQFWAHKNHIRIVQALALLKMQGEMPFVVFVGGDKGNKKLVTDAVIREGLREQVVDLGFIPTDDLQALYKGCTAVLMPTYFGPTNIPPLEAWQASCPLIYSQHLSNQTGDAALLIDPDDPKSIADAMLQSKCHEVRKILIKRGERRLLDIKFQREQAENKFLNHLETFAARLSLWS